MARLHAACFEVPRPWRAPEFAALARDPSVFVLHAPAGFAIGRAAADEAEVLTLTVAPGHRRQGHGARLLARFEAAARDRGARAAFLEVSADNAAARALYARAGYATTGRRPGYYRRPGGGAADALVLAKAIAQTAG